MVLASLLGSGGMFDGDEWPSDDGGGGRIESSKQGVLKMKKGIIVGIIAVLVVGIVVTALAIHSKSKDSNKAPASTQSTSSSGSSSSDDMSNTDSGSINGNASTPTVTDKVSITNFAFSPASIRVKKGAVVTWTNNDTTQHTVTADSGTGPHSQPLNKGDTYTYTFADAGTYAYHCAFHSDMTATVTVTE